MFKNFGLKIIFWEFPQNAAFSQSSDYLNRSLWNFLSKNLYFYILCLISFQVMTKTIFTKREGAQPATSYSLSLIITIVIMTLSWGLFVGLAAESCSRIWLPCLKGFCFMRYMVINIILKIAPIGPHIVWLWNTENARNIHFF